MKRWSLEGYRAVVTGGTRGIGLVIVAELLPHGAAVVVVARGETMLEGPLAAAADERRLVAVRADVATEEGRAGVIRALPNDWHAVDVLVNNVGTNIRKASLDFSPDQDRQIVDTNLTSAWELSRQFHPHLAASRRGSLVNIGSVAGTTSGGHRRGLRDDEGRARAADEIPAVEWAGDAIRVNLVAPWVHPHTARRADSVRPLGPRARPRAHTDGTRRRALRGGEPGLIPVHAGSVLRDRPDHRRRWRVPVVRVHAVEVIGGLRATDCGYRKSVL